MGEDVQRAEAPRAPKPSRALLQAREAQRVYLRGREVLERRSVVRGLLVLAVLVLVFSLVRAGLGRAFGAGWWKSW